MASPVRVLILGADGQVGSELKYAAWPSGWVIEAAGRSAIDLSDAPGAIARTRPSLVINAAGYTAVDKAEAEPELAFTVNRDQPAALADSCRAIDAVLVHFSTDYVFDGTKQGAYIETDPVAPISVYGASKAAGEAAIRASGARHLILRTSWVFGRTGRNFVRTMLALAETRAEISVVADQIGGPTSSAGLAAAVAAIAPRLLQEPDCLGTYHFAGHPAIDWASFAEAIFLAAAMRGRTHPAVRRIAAADYPTAARRPANSVLDMSRFTATFGLAPPDWRTALNVLLDEWLGSAAI